MRYLTCNAAESFVIGDYVTVTVLEVGVDEVRLAIEDTRQVPAYREVVLQLAGTTEMSIPLWQSAPIFADDPSLLSV